MNEIRNNVKKKGRGILYGNAVHWKPRISSGNPRGINKCIIDLNAEKVW